MAICSRHNALSHHSDQVPSRARRMPGHVGEFGKPSGRIDGAKAVATNPVTSCCTIPMLSASCAANGSQSKQPNGTSRRSVRSHRTPPSSEILEFTKSAGGDSIEAEVITSPRAGLQSRPRPGCKTRSQDAAFPVQAAAGARRDAPRSGSRSSVRAAGRWIPPPAPWRRCPRQGGRPDRAGSARSSCES